MIGSAASSLDAVHFGALLAIFFVAGVVGGLAGFAFAAVSAAAVWILPPTQAVALIIALSTCIQVMMVIVLKEDMRWLPPCEGAECALPYIAGGLSGSPIGLAALTSLPTNLISGLLGAFLFAYGVANLTFLSRIRIRGLGRAGAVGAGLLGGVVGGFSGFPGSVPVIYLSLIGLKKAEVRGVSQPFILSMQIFSLALLALRKPTLFQFNLLFDFAWSAPVAILGAFLGMAAYRRLSDVNFRRIVFALLVFSGGGLMMKAFSA